MDILHIYKTYWPVVGGIENHVRLLAERQAAAGHQVTVLVTSPSRHTKVEHMGGVHVVKAARLATLASTPLSLALPLRLASLRPDIAHLHFPYPLGEVSQLLAGRARRVVLGYHSDIIRQKGWLRVYRPVMHRILAQVDQIIAASPNYVESSETLQRYRAKCVIIPYGIQQERFRMVDADKMRRVSARLGKEPYVLFVGVLRYYKGLTYLLEAMPQVRGRLVIVGDGPLGPALREQAQALGLGERVVFAGKIGDDDLPAYYAAARAFVLPACERSEAFGLVQVEALASGLPIVSTELSTGTSYVNAHGASGLVVAPRDSAALAEALNRILEDTDLHQRLSEGARQRAALFEADRMVSQIEALYAEVLAGDGGQGS
jgi:rhamnosyl/mannosyltransferase